MNMTLWKVEGGGGSMVSSVIWHGPNELKTSFFYINLIKFVAYNSESMDVKIAEDDSISWQKLQWHRGWKLQIGRRKMVEGIVFFY